MESNKKVPQRLKIKLPYDLAIPLLGIYQRTVLWDVIEPLTYPCLLQHYSWPNFANSPDISQLINGLRKCGIYTHGALFSHKEE
jgi:hypothetical protein